MNNLELSKEIIQAWEEIYDSNSWGKYPPEYVVRFIARNYIRGRRDKIRVLDVGCGCGAVTWYLAREGFDVYAFDGIQAAINSARDYLVGDGLSAKIDVKDVYNLDYKDVFFDCVIDNASSCCMGTREGISVIYNKIFDMLKNEGRFLTVGFTMKCFGAGSGEEIEKGTYRNEKKGMAYRGGTIHYTDTAEMMELLQSS